MEASADKFFLPNCNVSVRVILLIYVEEILDFSHLPAGMRIFNFLTNFSFFFFFYQNSKLLRT